MDLVIDHAADKMVHVCIGKGTQRLETFPRHDFIGFNLIKRGLPSLSHVRQLALLFRSGRRFDEFLRFSDFGTETEELTTKGIVDRTIRELRGT